MEYAYIQLHAPEPPEPRDRRQKRDQDSPYPDYEQSRIYEDVDPNEDHGRVVVIDL